MNSDLDKGRNGRRSRREEAGFTLVEILVAVAVLAVALSAVITAMARQADNAGHLRNKTIAIWVAHNRLAELQLQGPAPDEGRSDGRVDMAGTQWEWRAEVSQTQDEFLRRVDIDVARLDEPDAVLVQITGFLSR